MSTEPRGRKAPNPDRSSAFTLRAHAKINLSLRIVGTRPDGYHRLETVFQSLALHDVLAFEECDEPFSLACSTPGVPADRRNLVWRAAAMLWDSAGRAGEPRGVRVRLTKRVPAQGGLGGGSADAAAALVGLDRVWRTGAGPDGLQELGRRLGADVPFFLCGGTALGLDRGDDIYPIEDLARRHVVLAFPSFGVSTPDAFRWFDEGASASGELEGAAADGGPAGVRTVRLAGGVALRVVNDLQAAVSRRHPDIECLCRQLAAAGAEAAAMTGSGSTVFGLFARREAAASAAAGLEADGWRVVVTRTAGRAARRRGAGWAREFTEAVPVV